MSWKTIVVLTLARAVVNQLPINGLADIGTSQALTIIFFGLAGLSVEEGLALGVVAHAIQMVLVCVSGGAGLMVRRYREFAIA